MGTRRTVSLDISGPVAALSRGLQLSHIVSATGRETGLPGGTVGLTVSGVHGASHDTHRNDKAPGHKVDTGPTTPTTAAANPKMPTAARKNKKTIDWITLIADSPVASHVIRSAWRGNVPVSQNQGPLATQL